MGCMGDREKAAPLDTQKWAYITFSDFKMTTSLEIFAYMWLWIMAAVGVAVYGLDTFTAVNLLAFDEWSSQVQPKVPFKYSKWIFAACIMFSWTLLFVEWIRAIRVIRRGGVAESYMDYLAANAQAMRPGGWKRFLVFSELTKSKKKVDYVAFFVYFAFKGAVRIVIAEGPRQVINALTLYSVMNAKILVHGGPSDGHSAIEQLFLNIQALAKANIQQSLILGSMLFTFVLWVLSSLGLLFSIILYLVFLWHYIPKSDGTLSRYCRRKIDKRLDKIVGAKMKAALEEEQRKARKLAERAAKKKQKPTGPARQPTLPQLLGQPEDKKAEVAEFRLHRTGTSTTVSTLPLYEARPLNGDDTPGLQRQPTLPEMAPLRPMPSRTATQTSNFTGVSYESDAPLLRNAGFPHSSPTPPPLFNRQTSDSSFNRPVPPLRSMTASTQGRGTPPPRSFNPQQRSPTSRSTPLPGQSPDFNFGFSQDGEYPPNPSVPEPVFGSQYGGPRYQSPAPMDREGSVSSLGSRPFPSQQRQPAFGRPNIQPGPFGRPRGLGPGPRPPPNQAQRSFTSPDTYTQRQPPPQGLQYNTFRALTPSSDRSGASIDSNSNRSYTPFRPAAQDADFPNALQPALRPTPERAVTLTHNIVGPEEAHVGHSPSVQQFQGLAPPEAQSRVVSAASGYGDILDSYAHRSHTPSWSGSHHAHRTPSNGSNSGPDSDAEHQHEVKGYNAF